MLCNGNASLAVAHFYYRCTFNKMTSYWVAGRGNSIYHPCDAPFKVLLYYRPYCSVLPFSTQTKSKTSIKCFVIDQSIFKIVSSHTQIQFTLNQPFAVNAMDKEHHSKKWKLATLFLPIKTRSN